MEAKVERHFSLPGLRPKGYKPKKKKEEDSVESQPCKRRKDSTMTETEVKEERHPRKPPGRFYTAARKLVD